MLAVTLIPTVRSTLNQRSEINDLRSQLGQKRETVAALQREQQQWDDPAFVEQQARERLKFVRVGETSYTVIGPEPAPAGAGPTMAARAQAPATNSPWYGQLWASMVIADRPTKVSQVKVKAPVKAPAASTPSATTSSAR